jgi:SWI/SNF-related matrix-associated actin-dependent regulator 1 of chromatin subfamily A
MRLRRFQSDDYQIVRDDYHFRALIAWSPGLGKGVLGCKIIRDNLQGPCVIVCPAYLKEHWRRELIRHIGMRPVVLHGLTPRVRRLPRKGRPIYILNYDILRPADGKSKTWTDILIALEPDLVILDESQFVKEGTAKRSKASRELCTDVPKVLLLSGTPAPSRPIELWHQLRIINEDLFPSKIQFGIRWCAGFHGTFGWDFKGSSNEQELFDILTSRKTGCMVRRRKEDVLTDLPKRERVVLPFELPPKAMKEYREAVDDFITWLRKQDWNRANRALYAEKVTQLGYLRRLAAELKRPQVESWIKDWLDDTDQKLLVFGLHKRAMLHPLFERFHRHAVLVTGDVDKLKRQAAFDRFNTDPDCRLLFGNLQAAGLGWSCTSASNVANVELGWVPGEHEQATDRCRGLYRGTGLPVTEYWIVAHGTIESYLCEILQKKMDVTAAVVDGKPRGDMPLFDELTNVLVANHKPAPKRRKVIYGKT